MELDRLYESIARLKALGVTVDAYNGCGDLEDEVDELDSMVLSDFMEYIYVHHSEDRPDWLEAFYQVLTWQFESFHEWPGGYYANLNGESSYEKQRKTADFLRDNGYVEIGEPFRRGMTPCEQGKYPKELEPVSQGIQEWMWDNSEAVWKFCLDVLEAHRLDWPEPEERKTDE